MKYKKWKYPYKKLKENIWVVKTDLKGIRREDWQDIVRKLEWKETGEMP